MLQSIVEFFRSTITEQVAGNPFWYISLVGSSILLAYSIHRKDLIFMLGLSLNTLIYVRNLHLIYKHGTKEPVGSPG
ncbi:MAG: lipid-A-disaccharide synthase N-terminal domain-containing protein [Sedimentisphaerales bacterium]|jgi:lipid-A-disaccharide synthase-like uncharacterized protein